LGVQERGETYFRGRGTDNLKKPECSYDLCSHILDFEECGTADLDIC